MPFTQPGATIRIPLADFTTYYNQRKRIFQAIRIEVNGELRILEQAILDFAECLAPKGRLSVITFHSLEDRIVKNFMRLAEKGPSVPRGLPISEDTLKKAELNDVVIFATEASAFEVVGKLYELGIGK